MGTAAQGGVEGFRALTLRYRGRTGLSQAALARRVGVHLRSIQGWEGGLSYPSAVHVRPLIAAFLETGGFSSGHELIEARALWAAIMREAPHFDTPFDAAWFADLPASEPGHAETPEDGIEVSGRARHYHWGEAPEVTTFLGRAVEHRLLNHWLLDQECRVIAILGLGGIGKTLLATRLAHDVAPDFDYVYW